MKKILLAVALIAIFVGTAAADPFNARIYNAAGTTPAPNPIVIHPGETLTFSYYGENFLAPNLTLEYNATVYALGGGAAVSDMTVMFDHPNLEPGTNDPYVDVGSFNVTLDANAPVTGQWQIVISAGEQGVIGLDFGSAARNFLIPEFPTIALPVAAILGLAFFMQRRKEE